MKTLLISADTNHDEVGMVAGWSIAASVAAVVNLRAGAVGGAILATVAIPAGESSVVSLAHTFRADGGCYVEVVSGTVSGVLWYF